MVGKRLLTPDTAPYGFYCPGVYVQEALNAVDEIIVAVTYDKNL